MSEPIQLPYSREAEEGLLGALLIDPECIRRLATRAADFYLVRNRRIFELISELTWSAQPVDVITVCAAAEKRGWLGEIGGETAIMALINATPSSLNAEGYARILAERAQRRELIAAAGRLTMAAFDLSTDVEGAAADAMTTLQGSVRSEKSAQHISVYASAHYDRLQEAAESPEEAARRILKTGIVSLDRATGGGLRAGEMVLLYGKPGLGKTKFLHKLGTSLAKNGYPGVIIQLETGQDEIMDREFSRETGIPTLRLETGQLADEEWPLYINAFEQMTSPDFPLHLIFGGSWSTTALRAELTRLVTEHGIRWFGLDYLRFLTDQYGESGTDRENWISIQLKRICNRLDLAGIVIHALNKTGIGADTPELEHGSGGAGISYDCDKALFMVEHIPEPGRARDPRGRTLIFKKSRRRLVEDSFSLIALPDRPDFVEFPKPKSKTPLPKGEPNDDLDM